MKKLVGVLCIYIPAASWAASFGITKNTPLTDLGPTSTLPNSSLTKIEKIPNPEGFTSFFAKVSKSGVVCAITAISAPFKTDPDGLAVRQAVDEKALAVKSQFGAYKQIDYMQPGALLLSTDQWIQAVKQGQRDYGYVWKKEFESNLVGGIYAIAVSPHIISETKAAVIKQVEFVSTIDCEKQ